MGAPKLAIGTRSEGSLVDYVPSNISMDENSVGESWKEIGHLHILKVSQPRYLLIMKGKIIIT